MWAILFGLALAAAVCFGVAAVVLTYSKYLAPAWTVLKDNNGAEFCQ